MHVLLMSVVCIEPVHRRSPVHRFLLLSLVVFGAAIRSADYVLPSHSDKVHNFVVVVVGLQLFGCNEPQVDLLHFLSDRRLHASLLRLRLLLLLLLRRLLSLRLRFLLKRRRRATVDAAGAATTTGHGLVVETSMDIATAAVGAAATADAGSCHGDNGRVRIATTGSGACRRVYGNRWRSSWQDNGLHNRYRRRNDYRWQRRRGNTHDGRRCVRGGVLLFGCDGWKRWRRLLLDVGRHHRRRWQIVMIRTGRARLTRR